MARQGRRRVRRLRHRRRVVRPVRRAGRALRRGARARLDAWPTTTTGSSSATHTLRGENTRQGLPARRPRARAGRPGRPGQAADRARARRDPRRGPRRRARSRGAAGHAPPKRDARARGSAPTRAGAAGAPRPAQDASGSSSPEALTPVAMPRHIVVGTAGHIDHGKSALVLALTGTDPDRLKEEKARGITIDLGFAHWTTGEFDVRVRRRPGPRAVRQEHAGRRRRHRRWWCSSSRPTSR